MKNLKLHLKECKECGGSGFDSIGEYCEVCNGNGPIKFEWTKQKIDICQYCNNKKHVFWFAEPPGHFRYISSEGANICYACMLELHKSYCGCYIWSKKEAFLDHKFKTVYWIIKETRLNILYKKTEPLSYLQAKNKLKQLRGELKKLKKKKSTIKYKMYRVTIKYKKSFKKKA